MYLYSIHYTDVIILNHIGVKSDVKIIYVPNTIKKYIYIYECYIN